MQLRQRRPLRRGHVGLPDVGAGIEDVVVGRRDVHVAAHDDLLRAGGDHLAQRGQPGELVRVVLRARLPPVRHVHGDHADPAARRGDRPRLGVREARRAGESRHHVVESGAREDGDPVPRRLTVDGDGVPALGQLLAEQLEERVVGELGLLQAHHVRAPLVEPRQQSRHALPDRVDVPGRESHRRTVAPAARRSSADGGLGGRERQLVAVGVDDHPVAVAHLAGQDPLGQGVLDPPLDQPLQRAGAVGGVVALAGQQLGRRPR